MAALDLFGRRWSLRIVWELRDGALGFRPLQQRCHGMSSSVLRQRLTELLDARLVCQLPDTRYELSPLGQGAYKALAPADAVVQGVGRRTGEVCRRAACLKGQRSLSANRGRSPYCTRLSASSTPTGRSRWPRACGPSPAPRRGEGASAGRVRCRALRRWRRPRSALAMMRGRSGERGGGAGRTPGSPRSLTGLAGP